jgi:hypothetical protein
MKLGLLVVVTLVVLLSSSAAMAQQDRPPRGGGGGPGGDGFGRGPEGRDGRPGPPDGRPPGAGGNPLLVQIEQMRGWLDIVDRYARLSRDPVSSGVAAVIAADDLLRNKPAEQAIEFFSKMMTEVKNEAVQRAIRLQLVELYGKNNQPDKALEQLRLLMIAAPPGAAGSAPAAPAALGSAAAPSQGN